MNTTFEYCNECNSEIELPAIMGYHKCPECGKPVMTCNLCLDNQENCLSNCPYREVNND